MVEIVSDSPDVEQAVQHLCHQVRRHGGLINDRLVIDCRGNDICINTPATIRDGEQVLAMPKNILLPIRGFQVKLNGDELVLARHDAGVTRGQLDVLQALLDVFNCTAKIAHHKRASTVLNWRRGESLFDHLAIGRSAQALPFLDNLHKLQDEQFIIASFFATRTFHFKGHVPGGRESGSQVLMPLIGFLNNHPDANSYLTDFARPAAKKDSPPSTLGTGGDGIMTVKSCPVPGSRECFVSYGNYDAMDTFINYNYIERHAAFVCSVPLSIDLPGERKVTINTVRRQPQHGDLPEQLKDLASYLPQMQVDPSGSEIALDFVLIPQNRAPYSMRRVLGVALSQIDAGLERHELLSALKTSETRIINDNHRYFQTLRDICANIEQSTGPNLVLTNAAEMARVQLEKIENYQFFAQAKTRA